MTSGRALSVNELLHGYVRAQQKFSREREGARRAFAANHDEQEQSTMTDTQLQKYQEQLPANDGWGDAAAEAGERTIRGTLLKFADWRWTAGKEATPLATAAGWVRWENGKPVEHRMREPGRRLPDRDELGYTDETEWEDGPSGDPKDPWSNTRWVYLVDPVTAEAFTFTTSSWGGREAVGDLGDQISRMRSVHPDAVPTVELRALEKPTRFGRKSKPLFKVVGWKSAGTNKPVVEKQITAKEGSDEVYRHEMDDEIPF
jgi:hypothetical protein